MAIFDKAKEKFQGFMQGSEQANRNRRSNGGTSGYRPVRNQNTPQPQQEVPAGAFGGKDHKVALQRFLRARQHLRRIVGAHGSDKVLHQIIIAAAVARHGVQVFGLVHVI